jgi:hypothetical protein
LAESQKQREAEAAAGGPLPDNWRTMSQPTQRALAVRFGASPNISAGDVDGFLLTIIQRETERQEAAKAFDAVRGREKT